MSNGINRRRWVWKCVYLEARGMVVDEEEKAEAGVEGMFDLGSRDFGFRVLEQEAKDDLEVEPSFRADLQNKEAISGFWGFTFRMKMNLGPEVISLNPTQMMNILKRRRVTWLCYFFGFLPKKIKNKKTYVIYFILCQVDILSVFFFFFFLMTFGAS